MRSLIIEKLQHIDDTIDLDETNLTPIQDFYKDAKVFVTGSTGFIGHVLIEKLLRSCPISKLYILIRSKKGKDVQSRLNALFDDFMFNRMKKAHPNFLEKVVAIEGDCAIEGLGLSEQDKELLIDEVNIVFHIAATVNFDEKLKKAVATNVRATRDLSVLAQQMPHLKSFLHVSTVYSNCIQNVIEEKVYPTAMNYQHLIDVTKTLDDLTLEQVTSHFVGDYPNTYIFTKQVAEGVVKDKTQGLPSGIYRPPIVLSTYKEPVRGWINNLYGPTGVVCGAGLGLIRVMYSHNEASAACVPADMCVNGLIAAAWDVSEKFQKSRDEKETFEISVYTYEKLTRLVKAYRKIHTFMALVGYFSVKSYQFNSANIRSMLERMSQKDRDVFFCDLKKLDWDDFFMTYGAGARVYLMKDPIDTVPQGKILVARYRWAHRILVTILGIMGITILWSVMSAFYRFILNS